MSPDGSSEPRLPTTEPDFLDATFEAPRPRAQRPSLEVPPPDEIRTDRPTTARTPLEPVPQPDEVRTPRQGPPSMPRMATPQPDEVRTPRQGPPAMPTLSVPQPDEIHAPRQGPPTMPNVAVPEANEVHAPRQGPPSMPRLAVPPIDEVRTPRQGPPTMPHLATPKIDEVRAARQGPPSMPSLSVPEPDEIRSPRRGRPNMPTVSVPGPDEVRTDRAAPANGGAPIAPAPREVEVRQDHVAPSHLPPMRVDPGRVEIESEGMRRKVRVMTTGVFDLLHLGHVHMLEAARALGDELYVVVARDETVRKMKHEPLNGEEIRRQIVDQLKPVTKALLGHVGDIYRTVQDVRPDIIALGYDQRFTEQEVQRKSAEHGVTVRVVRLPQFDHDLDATRKIIERIGDRIARKELYTQREG